jgi:RHS repeat-associated protein
VFYYGPGGILTEKQGSTFTAAYAYGNGLIRKDSEYPMFDGLGSERTICNSSQTVTGTIIQDGFGLTVATTGSSTNPYKFAATSGYRDDGDCGLSHVGARYYDSQVGRFITRDTDLDEHPYLYCAHDPVNSIDPSGRGPELAVVLLWMGPFGIAIAATLVVAVVIFAGIEYANSRPSQGPVGIPWEQPRPKVTPPPIAPGLQIPDLRKIKFPWLHPDGTPAEQPYHPPFTEGPEPFPWGG